MTALQFLTCPVTCVSTYIAHLFQTCICGAQPTRLTFVNVISWLYAPIYKNPSKNHVQGVLLSTSLQPMLMGSIFNMDKVGLLGGALHRVHVQSVNRVKNAVEWSSCVGSSKRRMSGFQKFEFTIFFPSCSLHISNVDVSDSRDIRTSLLAQIWEFNISQLALMLESSKLAGFDCQKKKISLPVCCDQQIA
jgi:hypothetical protein